MGTGRGEPLVLKEFSEKYADGHQHCILRHDTEEWLGTQMFNPLSFEFSPTEINRSNSFFIKTMNDLRN